MKKFSKKGVLLFAGAMAVCAFVMPSMASALSWGPSIGTESTLHSGNIGFTGSSGVFGAVTSSCTRSSFTATVASAQNLEITHATFGGHCVAIFPGVAGGTTCTATAASTSLPWTATARTTSDIQIHGIRIDVFFENTPGNAACSNATLAGRSIIITGTLTSGRWTGNAAGAVDYSDAEGLVSHSPSTAENGRPVTVRGSILATGLTIS